MDNKYKFFTEEAGKALMAALEKSEMQAIIKGIKDGGEVNGTFRVVISTDDTDRQGDIVDQKGWDTKNYENNSVVLWAHDYAALPIGVATRLYKEEGKTIAEGKFASAEANPFAQQVRKLYDEGIVRATSVGFIVKERDTKGVITKAELLEFSFVPVPANPFCIDVRQLNKLGIDLNMAAAKGLAFEVKQDEPAAADAETETENTPAEAAAETETEAAGAPVEDEKEKGAVADRVAATEAMEYEDWDEKYENMEDVWEIIYALGGVYNMPETPVEAFGELLKEAAAMLIDLANGIDEPAEKGIVSKAKIAGTYKAGRMISAANMEKLKAIAESLATVKATLEEAQTKSIEALNPVGDVLSDLLKTGDSNTEAETEATVEAKHERSKASAGYPAEKQDNTPAVSRKDLQDIATTLNAVLAEFRAAARAKSAPAEKQGK